MQKKRQKQKPIIGSKLGIVIVLIIIVAIVFLISSGGTVSTKSSANEAEISENVSELKALEEKSPTEFKDNTPAKILDMDAEKEKILAMEGCNPDPSIFMRWYEGTAIVGDSIMLRVEACGYLGDDVVCGIVGQGVYGAEEVVQKAISLQPYVIIVGFGANDMVAYGSDTDAFIEQYDAVITELEEGVPQATIYINSVMPGQPGNSTVPESFQYCDDYNVALSKYCEEKGITFIDSRFILETYPDLYDADGFHPTWEFYPMWLTYVADITGLSNGEVLNSDGTLDESTTTTASEDVDADSDTDSDSTDTDSDGYSDTDSGSADDSGSESDF